MNAYEMNEWLLNESIKGLSKGYNKTDFDVFCKAIDNKLDLMKLEEQPTNIEDTLIDDNLDKMRSCFVDYIQKKKEYNENPTEQNRENTIKCLNGFLDGMEGILTELKTSSDFEKEREMIREKLRYIFSIYQA